MLGNGIYCGKCDKSFTSIEERNKHEARHDDPKNFVCGNCDKRFKKMDDKDFHESHRVCFAKIGELQFQLFWSGCTFGNQEISKNYKRI